MNPRLSTLLAALRRFVPARVDAYFDTLRAPELTRSQRALHAARGVGWLCLGGALLLVLYTALLVPFTPAVDGLLEARGTRPSVLLAADGSQIARFKRLNREWVGLDAVAPHVVDALVATEDHRYWKHNGIDWQRNLSALGYTLGGDRQGASTLTQQLARNFFPEQIGRAPSVTRKLKEMITAVKIERAYSKADILEAYLNTVPFLYNAIGIEMAARTYFDKRAAELTVQEAATLVGMLKGTSAYNPVQNPERARERRNVVLAQMVKHGKLSQASYDKLSRQPLRLDFERQDVDLGTAPHFAEAVRRWLADWATQRGYDIYADGLVVQSALDPAMQRLASRAVTRRLESLQAVADVEWGLASSKLLSTSMDGYRQRQRKVEPFSHFWTSRGEIVDAFVRESPEFARVVAGGATEADALARLRADADFMNALRARKTRLEGGFVAVDPRSGTVRAWVGSRDFATDSFDHVQQARRQPGSTFKPFVYGAALEAGMDPGQLFPDRPVAIRLPDGRFWKPSDMGGASGLMLSLEEGLVQSRNTVTAQVIDAVGAQRVAEFAQRMGVRTSPLDAVPSLGLGTSGVTLLEMVSAYGTLAALGEYRAPLLVTRISDRHGKVLAQFAPQPEVVLERDVALQLIEMLRAAVDRGTGQGIRAAHGIHADVAGKTGTTQNNSDGWFILMHRELVLGAWVGFNDPRVTLRSDYWGQGAHNALHVVGDVMREAFAARLVDEATGFPTPGPVVTTLRGLGERLKDWFGIDILH